MHIRNFRLGDEPALHAVFFSAVHEIANHDYTAEQLNAWAPRLISPELWATRMRRIKPLVVELDDKPIGYSDVQADGYIDHFYVASVVARQGVGTLLMRHINKVALAQGTRSLSANVSRTAQPFFAKCGFVLVEDRLPIVNGVAIPNAFMRKSLYENEV